MRGSLTLSMSTSRCIYCIHQVVVAEDLCVVVAVVAVVVLNPLAHIAVVVQLCYHTIHYASGLSNVYHNHLNISSPNC